MVDVIRRHGLALVMTTAVATAVVSVAAAGTFRGIEPSVLSGNPGCANVPGLGYQTQVNFDSPQNGSSASGVYLIIDGNRVSWYTLGDILVKAVIVKGGNNGNVYRYTSGQDYSDGGLFPPLNQKTGTPYTLGSVRVCY